MCLFDSQILFCKRAGSVGVNACYKTLPQKVWLVAIATILNKTLKIHFLFMSAIAHNWSFFTKLKQTFWSIYRVPFHLNKHYCTCFYLLEEKGSANEIEADKKEVEIEDPVCITLEYYR